MQGILFLPLLHFLERLSNNKQAQGTPSVLIFLPQIRKLGYPAIQDGAYCRSEEACDLPASAIVMYAQARIKIRDQ